ncbi:MAG: glycosyltransferase family 2 protein [Candidatus Parcubacteria bacterium]|nr:glycosyltransferase family 2 protein [Candidatus Parcubacteria bacterium]
MQLSIIIINWNVKDLLRKNLQSIFKLTQGLEFEVFVVDNASKDGSVAMIMSEFPQVNLIASNENLGFAKGNNLALEQATGKYVLFMNPDMELKENSFKILVDWMGLNSKIDLGTCQLIYPDGSRQNNIKNNPGLCDQLLILLKLHHLIQLKCLKQYLAKDFDYTKEQEVKQIMGAFTLVKNEVIADLGGWDEDYFLWWEDLDLCKRAQAKGYQIWYTPQTKVIHYEAKSFEQEVSLVKQKRFNRGMEFYFRKHSGSFSCLVVKLLSFISLGLAWVSQILKVKPRTQSKI